MLVDKIDEDLKSALKNRDTLRVSTLRFLKASILNLAIDKKVEKLEDSDVLEVIAKLVKQHLEAIEGFSRGNRQDLVTKETQELEILRSYCPPQASDQELREWIQVAITESGAKGPQDLGKVMKCIIPKTKGKADGKRVNELVKEALEGDPHGRTA